ncbi:4Fe-4S binding protein [Varunaivibrio sulfuroxidans]|uniref:Formate hydrogenlyase subunit 6/NADH:ubiquinone oxidoreductase subunit I n=1 Tax=Varunaivibrio sulfuroxidans TaxID=1773489 RepID=A0A4R3JCP8_9PROT|nr:4Fe-4S binding protein [Varunaivibrio sulfuroxidans]TCS63447.1 formate hydrogenlyase subunit 6/NADH:ubiquinone oxidoreductase subunit I [Varunaivibrio sulfuroxidans]WES30407.1 4Fe-4S binding protein [Varunaivibrio sulfuroxidans]
MTESPAKILLCDCNGAMRFDIKTLSKALGSATIETFNALCRHQIDAARHALAQGGGRTVRIACTQEAPIFLELSEGNDAEAALSFVNIREQAGWSREGGKATAKMAALIAEAGVHAPPATQVSMQSEGRLLILGAGDEAIRAAQRLDGHLDITVALSPEVAGEIMPPAVASFPIFFGAATRAGGHLGNFNVSFASLSPSDPSSRNGLGFTKSGGEKTLSADLILDLRAKTPLFPAAQRRDGYVLCAPNDSTHVERALFDLIDMVGTFDKPRYVNYESNLCAHARNAIQGCRQCLDICPTGAIGPDGDHVAIDPYICAGCGGCAGVCPTGAVEYAMPSATTALARLRVLMQTARKAGESAPRVLIHDQEFGAEAITLMARFGQGLPARVIPFAMNEVTQLSGDVLLGALAHGACRVFVLAPPHKREDQDGLLRQVALANEIVGALGYGEEQVCVIDSNDPEAIAARLYQDAEHAPARSTPTGGFASVGKKRHRLHVILEHLHDHAPTPVDILPLTPGAPFGAVIVDQNKCTLCLSCVNACPAAALTDNPNAPQLNFREINCIQCGLCRTTCPEDAITLEARIDFTRAALTPRTVKEEEPFACVRCAKPFGVRSTIERMIEKVKDNPMFAEPEALNRLRMCDQCRVIDLALSNEDPWASTERRVKSTDDYLAERDKLRQDAATQRGKSGEDDV